MAIEYGFKEFMDSFPEGQKEIRKIYAPDEQDKRPYQDIFRDQLAVPAVKDAYDRQHKQSLDTLRQSAYTEPAAPIDPDPTAEAGDVAAAALGTAQGICLDDDHGKGDSKDFLLEDIADLKAAGVTTLFIEHFWQEYPDMLDDYINGPDEAELPPALATAVEKLNAQKGIENKGYFRNMLAEAGNKIRIVGLDTFDAKTPQDDNPRLGKACGPVQRNRCQHH